jgi:uncharacterized membrane protein
MKNKIAKLIDLKSIVTMALVGTLIYLAVVDRSEPVMTLFVAIVGSVITFYFTKKANGGDDGKG